MIDIDSYQASFGLLLRDLERALEYVEPVDANEGVYSHRFYELYLRACTEFESICRDSLVEAGSSISPGEMTMKHYRTLEKRLKLEPVRVYLRYWRPEPREVMPFEGWSKKSPPWYEAHHAVKHNRQAQFPVANLGNVAAAVSGLLAILVKIDDAPFLNRHMGMQHVRGGFEQAFDWDHFSVRWPLTP